MGQLTYTQLNNLLYDVIISNINYPILYNDAMRNYYNLGIRPSELTDVSLWQYIDDNNIILSPLKNNNNRVFTSNEFTSYMLKSIYNRTQLYDPINEERLKQYFKKVIKVYGLKVGNKRIECNLYRHRYIKGLAIDGLTPEEITLKMGYIHPNTVYSYLNSVITFPE